MAEARKRYLYKIYSSTGTFLTTWADVISEPTFTIDINGGLGELVVDLARSVLAFGENDDVAYNNQLKLYCFDIDQPTTGVLVYSGYISRYEPIIDGRKETVRVTFLSYIHQAARLIMEDDNVGTVVATNYGGGYTDDITPTMTNDSTPSPYVTAASTVSGTDSAYKAIDKSTSTRWQATALSGTLSLDFGSGVTKVVRKYGILVGTTEHDKDPKDWTFEGSNNGSSWTVLHTVKAEQAWGDSEKRTFQFENDTPYRYYRINITDNNGHASAVHIYELTMYEGVAYSRSGATTLKYLSKDPTNILKDILDRFTAAGGKLDYSTSPATTEDTATSASYTFNTNSYKEALEKIVELCPVGWYIRIGADDKVYLKNKASTAEHSFILGQHISYYKPEKRTENMVNRIFFRGGDITGNGDYLFKKYSRSSSISTYGEHAIKMNDERVKLSSTMDLMAGRVLDALDSPEVRITVKVQDNNVVGAGEKFVNESMVATPATGSITGDAAWNAGGYIALTPAANSKQGRYEFTGDLGGEFVCEFEHYAGPGSGADATYFYWGCSSLPTTENSTVGGYLLSLDEYNTDALELKFNGSVVKTTSPGVTLDNATYRRIKLVASGKYFKVYINETLVWDFTDSARTLPGLYFGFGARTGGINNEHRIRSVVITKGTGNKFGYDIESIYVGQMVKILNSTSKGDNKWDIMIWDTDSWDYDITNAAATLLQIQRIEYHPDFAILEVSNRQPDIAKRIEDINRNLVNDQTLDNPAIPS